MKANPDIQLVFLSFGATFLKEAKVIYANQSERSAIERLSKDPKNNMLGIDWSEVIGRVQPASNN